MPHGGLEGRLFHFSHQLRLPHGFKVHIEVRFEEKKERHTLKGYSHRTEKMTVTREC